MKHVILLLISMFFAPFLLNAQTYISPVIGIDFAKIEATKISNNYNVLTIVDEDFSIKSPFYSLRIEQKFKKKYTVSYEINYSKKSAHAGIALTDFVVDSLKFNYIRNNLSFSFLPHKKIMIGIGYNFNLIRKLRYYPSYSSKITDNLLYDNGICARVGAQFKNFELMSYFYKSVHFSKQDLSDIFNISSFGICLSHKFSVFKPRNRSSECPKF